MSSTQSSSARKSRKNRTSVWREKAASYKEEIETIKQREKILEEAKEQLQIVNNRLIQRLRLESNKRLPFDQTFNTFKACLETEKQRELMLLALKRHVSSTPNHLNGLQFKKEKSAERTSNESIATSSEASIKENVSGKDSGLEIDEVCGLKEEIQGLKVENGKLHSEIENMTKDFQDQRAVIEEIDESLQGSRQKCKMYQDHSSLLAFEAFKLCEEKCILEKGLLIRQNQLEELEVKNTEDIRQLSDEHNKKMIVKVLKIEELEQAMATVEQNNSELKEELRQMEVHGEVSDVVNDIVDKCLDTSFDNDMSNCLKENDDIKNELSIMKAENEDYQSKVDESAICLEESNKNCAMHEEQASLLTSELKEVHEAKANLENQLSLMDAKLKLMEESNEEKVRKITKEYNARLIEEELKMDSLKEENARYLEGILRRDEQLEELTMKLSAKRIASETIVDALTATYEVEAGNYEKQIKDLQRKITEGEAVQKSLAEKAKLSELELSNTSSELLQMKQKHQAKVDELLLDNTAAHVKFLEEQTERVKNCKALKLKLDSVKARSKELHETNSSLERTTKGLESDLKAKQKKIENLEEQVVILYDRLGSKDLAIQQFLTKKRKRSGLRRLFCC